MTMYHLIFNKSKKLIYLKMAVVEINKTFSDIYVRVMYWHIASFLDLQIFVLESAVYINIF